MTNWPVIYYHKVDSTNLVLKQMDAPTHGTVVHSAVQTAGRGRLGRSFSSQEGGLYLSVYLNRREPMDKLLHLTPMVAVAVRRAIREACGVDVQIKWINDLVKDGKKLCGILVEIAPQGGVIVGVGINCNTKEFPAELAEIAGSLCEFCERVDQTALLDALIRNLQEMDEGLFSLKAQWMEEYASHCVTVGKEVLLYRGESRRQAYAEAIDENGALRVRLPDGTEESISTGEASIRGMHGYSR
ncbi:MAG: biotin--[Oscillospiraceae bacterium]|nr:biotin--[acetyl-CoA-carboxylase] ligase [Oscillospiraceae bacterium]